MTSGTCYGARTASVWSERRSRRLLSGRRPAVKAKTTSRKFWSAWTRRLLRTRLSPPSALSVGETIVSNGNGSTSESVN